MGELCQERELSPGYRIFPSPINADMPLRSPRHVGSFGTIRIQRIPKQYRVLGLTHKASSISNLNNTASFSISPSTSAAPSPTFKPVQLSDCISTLIEQVTTYFNLYNLIPPEMLDSCLRSGRSTEPNFRHLENEFLNCLSRLRNTLWCIQTLMRDENPFVNRAFRQLNILAKKYLARCSKGWKRILMTRSSLRHYRAVSTIRLALKRGLGDVQEIMNSVAMRVALRRDLDDMREIINSAGPHYNDMVLNVDVEEIAEWINDLDRSRDLSKHPEDLEVNADWDGGDEDLGTWYDSPAPSPLSPTFSEEKIAKRQFKVHHPEFSLETLSRLAEESASFPNGDMVPEFLEVEGGRVRTSYLSASILNLR